MSVTTISTHFTKRNAKDDVIATLCSEVRFGVRWVNNLWVDGESRGEGYATELLQQCIEEFYGQDLYLMVRAYNDQPLADEDLVEFYAQFGFEEIDGAPSIMVRPGDKPKPTKVKPKKKQKPAPARKATPQPSRKRFRGQADEEDPDDDEWEEEEEEPKPLRRTTRPAKEKLPPGHRPPFHVEGVGAFDESKPEENNGIVAQPESKGRRRR